MISRLLIFLFLSVFIADVTYAQDSLKDLYVRARQGDADAQRRLGKRLLQGDGVDRNTHGGAKWISMAAEQGDSRALLMMGDLHRHGTGVAQNMNKARDYYNRAVRAGNKAAKERLEKYFPEHSPKPSPKPQPKPDPQLTQQEEAIRVLREKNIPINNKELHNRVACGDTSITRLLLQAGVNIESAGANGCTPLMVAAREHLYEMCKLLLAEDADANACLPSGKTALTHALQGGYTPNRAPVVKLLIKEGCDVNKTFCFADEVGNITPLMFAVFTGDASIVQALLDGGANAAAKDLRGQTALQLAEKLPLTPENQKIISKLRNAHH